MSTSLPAPDPAIVAKGYAHPEALVGTQWVADRLAEPWLRVLHRQQVELLRTWRGLKQEKRQAEADSLLPRLLLTVNAVAGGLRTTG